MFFSDAGYWVPDSQNPVWGFFFGCSLGPPFPMEFRWLFSQFWKKNPNLHSVNTHTSYWWIWIYSTWKGKQAETVIKRYHRRHIILGNFQILCSLVGKQQNINVSLIRYTLKGSWAKWPLFNFIFSDLALMILKWFFPQLCAIQWTKAKWCIGRVFYHFTIFGFKNAKN